MALDMSQIERIRDLRALGYSPSEIRRETGYSYPTIRKYLAIDDFSPKRPGARTGRPSLLDGLEGDIEEMLESDRHCYHKQRHTARRVYDRLVAEKGYAGSCSTVQRKVREMRRAMRQPAKDGYVRLHWEPGTMQVDFGQADFDYAFGGSADGDRVRMHFLSMSFPYSNDARCEVFGDEKDVCVCQGLQDAFDMIGGVPRVVVLDNATEAGRRWHDVVLPSRSCSGGSGFTTASRRGSATPTPATRKATSRTRWASSAATTWSRLRRSATSGTTTRPSTRRSRTAPAGRPIMRRG